MFLLYQYDVAAYSLPPTGVRGQDEEVVHYGIGAAWTGGCPSFPIVAHGATGIVVTSGKPLVVGQLRNSST